MIASRFFVLYNIYGPVNRVAPAHEMRWERSGHWVCLGDTAFRQVSRYLLFLFLAYRPAYFNRSSFQVAEDQS